MLLHTQISPVHGVDVFRLSLSAVSPEDTQTSVLMSRGTFTWQGPDGTDQLGEGDTESGAAKGSLLLHSLNLHITMVLISYIYMSVILVMCQ